MISVALLVFKVGLFVAVFNTMGVLYQLLRGIILIRPGVPKVESFGILPVQNSLRLRTFIPKM